MKIFRPLIIFMLLTMTTAACSLTTQTSSPGINGNQPVVPDNSFWVSYRNISFVTPPFYSNKIIAEELELADAQSPADWPPSFFQIQFHDQADLAFADSLTSLVQVYPVDQLSQTYIAGANAISTLQSLLANNQAALPSTGLPFWPMEYYTQVVGAPLESFGEPALTVHAQYLDFQTGHGIRYLTFMENHIARTSRMDRLIYTYQGLTSDGQFYISVIIPLFVNDDATRTDLNSLETQNPPDYSGMVERLTGMTADQFHLSLTECDNMIASLSVAP